MKQMICRVLAAAALVMALSTGRLAAQTQARPDSLAGAWTGNASCLINHGICRDHNIIVRVAPLGADSASRTITVAWVVGGREVEPDTARCDIVDLYTIRCPNPPARPGYTWELTRVEDAVSGYLIAADGTRVRVIYMGREGTPKGRRMMIVQP